MAIQGILRHALNTTTRMWTPILETWQLNSNLNVEDILGYPTCGDGIRQVVDTVINEEVFTLQVNIRSIDKLSLGLLLDSTLATSTNFTIPRTICNSIPSGGGTVTVTGLTLDQQVQVTTQSATDPKQLLQQASGTGAAPGRFEVSANTITFDAAEGGESIVIRYLETIASGETYGLSDGQQIGEVAFAGEILGTRFDQNPRIYFPRCVRTSGIGIGQGQSSQQQYRLNLPNTGYRIPLAVYLP